jgi:hypothetical protein
MVKESLTYKLGQFEKDIPKKGSRKFVLDEFRSSGINPEGKNALFLTGDSLSDDEQIIWPAGFEGENTYGIERNKEVVGIAAYKNARRYKFTGRKINVKNSELSPFLENDRQYALMNLDFLQNYGPDLIKSLDDVFQKGSLDEEAVLAVNMQAKREQNKYTKRLMYLAHPFNFLELKDTLLGYEAITAPKYFEEIKSGKQLKRMSFGIDRSHLDFHRMDKSIGFKSIHPLQYARNGLSKEVELRAKYPLLMGLRVDEVKDFLGSIKDEKTKARLEKGLDLSMQGLKDTSELHLDSNYDSLQDPVKFAAFADTSLELMYMTLGKKILGEFAPEDSYFNAQAENTEKTHEFLKMGILFNNSSGYSVEKVGTHKYKSTSKTPMFMQTFHLKRRGSGLEKALSEAFSSNSTPIGRLLNSNQAKYKVARKAFFGKEEVTPESMGELMSYSSKSLGGRAASLGSFRGIDKALNFLNSKKWAKTVGSIIQEGRNIMVSNNMDPVNEPAFKAYHNYLKEQQVLIEQEQEKIDPKYRIGEHDFNSIEIPAAREEVISENKVREKVGLSSEDKVAITELREEGYSPKEIYDTFPKDSGITRPMVGAVCAWVKIRKDREAKKKQVA